MTDLPEDLIPDRETDTLEEQADLAQPYGEVTSEDLSTEELVFDGADLLTGSADGAGALRQDDEREEETIDERLAQEEYDPASAIVPPRAGDLTDRDEEAEMLAQADAFEAGADVSEADVPDGEIRNTPETPDDVAR